MAAGTIGAYLGADNIIDYVPPDCFVDRRAFGSNAELHEFLTAMDDSTCQGIPDASAEFLAGPDMHPFSTQLFVSTLMTQIEGLRRRPLLAESDDRSPQSRGPQQSRS